MDTKKILLYVGIGLAALVLVVGVSGTMAVVLIRSMAPSASGPAASSPVDTPAISADKANLIELKPFVTNLADKPRYISVSFALVGRDTVSTTKLKDSTPFVRDAIIAVLNSMTSTEVSDEAGSNTLKTEIIKRLNTVMGSPMVDQVLVTEKVIQH